MENMSDDAARSELIKKRLRVKLDHQRETLIMEYKHKVIELALENKLLVYSNQKEGAYEIITHFRNGKHAVILVAQPGVGKTGAALELAYSSAVHPDDDIIVDKDNIHFLCGMNDTEWGTQFKKNMLKSLTANIAHRSIIKKSLSELRNLQNGLIITDECHIASGKNMTESKTLREAGLLNIENLSRKNNKLCYISATPESMLQDVRIWGDKGAIVFLKPGPMYKGFQVMMDEQRIRDAPELNTKDDITNFLKIFETRYDGHTKRYFPMRGLKGIVISLLYSVTNDMGWDIILHDSDEPIDDVDILMAKSPERHTVILVKEYWRASKRMIRTHIGGTYEKSPKKRNTTATAQGLTARQCDNYEYDGDWLNPDLRPLNYCDLAAIEEYLDWINNGCNYDDAELTYSGSNTKSKNGRVKSRQSLLHPSNVSGLDAAEDTSANVPSGDHKMSSIFQSQQEAMEWGRTHINWSGVWNTQGYISPIKVNPCKPDGSPGNTHYRCRSVSQPIVDEEVFRRQGDFKRFGGGVRCVPIKRGDQLSYTIVYKSSWLIES